MNYIARWDWFTLVLYLTISAIFSIVFKISIRSKKNKEKIKIFSYKINKRYVYYFFIAVFLVLFITTRVIKDEIGGADSKRYIYFFDTFNYVRFDLIKIIKMQGWEYLFFNFMFLVKSLGGNYTIFSIFIYSIIVLSYIYYFDKNLVDENENFITMLFILPFLKSMNIVRNIFAASIGLFGLEQLKNNKKNMALLLFVVAYLNHYISIVLFGFYIFFLIPERFYNTRKKSLIITFCSVVLTTISVPLIKYLLSLTRYSGYSRYFAFSIWGYLVYGLMYLLIMLVYDDYVDLLIKKRQYILYKILTFLTIVIPIFAVLNGSHRLLIYFDLPRYVMYSNLFLVYNTKIEKLYPKYKKFFRIFCIIIVIAWIIFRIWRMYEPSHIMPYRNIFFER